MKKENKFDFDSCVDGFHKPNNPEISEDRIKQNKKDFVKVQSRVVSRSISSKSAKLDGWRAGEDHHVYDDDFTRTLAEEFLDRISATPLFGDILRSQNLSLVNRKKMNSDHLATHVIDRIISNERISRNDVAEMTLIEPTKGNKLKWFMNGGPLGERWNTDKGGFYDHIQNCKESIIGVELGFKADEYGKQVKDRLIKKKKSNPNVHISILIDGLVSILFHIPQDKRNLFENETIAMIEEMKNAGISVRVNDTWNPSSSDFLAANHVKLWIFDGEEAFFGGIGIESQFVKELYDQMDLVRGPFVKVLNMVALLMMTNQRRFDDKADNITQVYEMPKKTIEDLFSKNTKTDGSITMRLSMNVPGYIQDAQSDYIRWLSDKRVDEIFIMAPYFSDDKIARALVKAAKNLLKKLRSQGIQNPGKKIHVIFPKKQENILIEQVSIYYALILKDNPIVETLQFSSKAGEIEHQMMHAKQMVVVLKDKDWIKYIKFGGSYNPAGRAHNMWELNATMYENDLDDNDDSKNCIKQYVETVMRDVIDNHTETFDWVRVDKEIPLWKKILVKFVQLLWF